MLTLPGLLRATAQSFGHRVALRGDGAQRSWVEWVDQIACTASVLQSLGLQRGDRFGILGRNCALQGQLIYAGYWAGIVPVPLNFRLAPPEIAQMLRDAHCRVLLVDPSLLQLLDHPALQPWRANAIAMPVDAAAAPGRTCLAELLAAARPAPPADVQENDDALLLFTGGTTGRSKGVRLSHRNIVTNAMQLARVMNVCEDDVYLHVSPMFHSTDLKATVVTMHGGGHVYLKAFSAEAVLEAVARHRVTILSIVPTMIVRLLDEGNFGAHDLRSLRLISYGTSPIDEGVLRRAMAAFDGVGFHQCYGLTETSPLLAILDERAHRRGLQERPALLRAAGRILPGVEVRLLSEDGRPADPGRPGQIVVRGPQVSCGYLERPEDTAAAFGSGWFRTGDIGRIDEEGYLHVLGRMKDMVITGGENVYTREVERVLEQHPDVQEVAVVGVPDAQFGEALLAAIVLRPQAPRWGGTERTAALVSFCRDHLGGFKIPRRYQFLEALPRTAMGKVRKHEIVRAYAEQADREEATS
jgi:long-chain acyl-CoA synthetase